MKGIDYTKALSKDREYFQDTIRKTQESADKKIAANNERTEHVVNNQRDNFIEDKADLEKHYQTNLAKLNEKTRNSLENNSSKANEERNREREEFTLDAINKRKDFDQRLSDITNSYKKSFESDKNMHKDLQNTAKNKYEKNITDTKNNAEEQLKTFRDKVSGTGRELKDQYNRERQQLVRRQEDRITDVQKEAGLKRAEQREHLRADFQKAREVQQSDFEHQKQYTEDRASAMQKKYEARSNAMALDYSQRSDNLTESQQKEAVRKNRENQDNLTEVRRDFNKQLRLIDLEKRRRDNGSGEFAEVQANQQGLNEKLITENKMKHLKGQITDTQKTYQVKAEADQAQYNDDLKTAKIEATARLDRKLNEANADKIVTVSKERENSDEKIGNLTHQNRLDKGAYEQQLVLERANAKERINKLKENFNNSMKQLDEKHKTGMEDVTKISHKDKVEFVKQMQENRNNEMFAMKREFNKMMDATVQQYEERLGNYQRENDYLKITMDQKVQNIIDQTDRQLDSQRTLFDERRKADNRNQAVVIDQKEHQLKTAMNQMNNNFQKKIDKMQVASDTKLKLLTNDYESKLKELQAMTSKELATRDTNHQIEMARLKTAYEDEKNRTVSQFENQIAAIKTGHADQMEAMKDFKKLS